MVSKKIRKNAMSLTNLVITMLLCFSLYIGMFAYFSYHSIESGVAVDNIYSNASDELESAQLNLQENITLMQENFAGIGEADNTFLSAWNGLKGLGQALKLPFYFLNVAIQGYKAFESTIALPVWVQNLIYLSIIVFIVLLLYAILKGDQQKV